MKFKKAPWAHQLEALKRAAFEHNYALFFEMGTGKTATAINILRSKFNDKGRVLRTIIFTLPLPIPQWKQEWLDNSTIDPKQVIPLYGSGKKRLKTFEQSKDKPVIFITNYETLLMKEMLAAFVAWEPEAVVLDESHKCKSHSTARSRFAFELANPFDRIKKQRRPKPHTILLTGSPVLNSPMDLFQQFKIMDGGETFGSNFFAFRAKYFRDRNAAMPKEKYFPNWEPMSVKLDGIDGLGLIQASIQTKSMRVLKADCLDLPPELSVTIKVGMTAEQTRLYNEMKRELVTYYQSKACVASLAITKALRLMQITSGYLATETPGQEENKKLFTLPGTPKEAALKELLSEITEAGGKVLVWSVFKQNYETIRRVCGELEIEYVEVHGEISESNKRLNVSRFQRDASCRVLVGHPGSGGVGLNLAMAGYSIFYSRNFSLEHYLQARARNHRGGSREAGHEKITHYDLVCEGTIDELAVKKLANKQDLSDKLLSEIVQDL